MDTIESSINERVAAQVRGLRAQLGLSLEALARSSGVSRSMISLIERGEASSTATVLERLATGH
jgi:transcriptional regulator with XRE-family HTH domain